MLPFVGKTDIERRVVINTVGPVWEGNQVWFILGGGAIFAAWPPLYAVSFSGFYLAMFVILAAFIVRPVAFKYRSKRDDPRWRNGWDWALFAGGAIPALLFGVAVGNVIQGVPFHFTDDLHTIYEGAWYMKFIGLLDPFSILAGVVSLSMLVMHGGGLADAQGRRRGADTRPRHRVDRGTGGRGGLCRWRVCGWRSGSKASASWATTSPMARPTRCISRWSGPQAG